MTPRAISSHGQAGHILIASCLGDDTGGGLFSFDGMTIEQIDRLSSTGLCTTGTMFLRLLWSPTDTVSTGDLLVYDAHGVARYYRIDELLEPHDILWDGHSFVVVSTYGNSILWISPSGEIERRWRAPGTGDSWHLNSLLLHDGELLVAAFGKFENDREWKDRLTDGTGFVLSLATGREVLTGLSGPHHPRFFDGHWTVCNSATRQLLQIDPGARRIIRQLELGGWTRGIAVTDDLLFVGESAHRFDRAPGAYASIAVISRRSWALLDRLPLPCRESTIWFSSLPRS